MGQRKIQYSFYKDIFHDYEGGRKLTKVIVIGGGWAGCAAAISARKAGAEVIVIERMDILLGLGNVGGLTRNNGRYTAAEECILLGGKELFDITDRYSRHKNVDFPGHKHASIYDVNFVESAVTEKVKQMGIELMTNTRVTNVVITNNHIEALKLEKGDIIKGDSFIDTTGSTGPVNNCYKYGNGCAMCILRCPAYGGRVSISEKCGVPDMIGKRKDDTFGSFSGSIKIKKETLSKDIQEELNSNGVVVIPLPKEEVNSRKLDIKICRQYATKEYVENIVLLDTGHAKLMAPFYPIHKLRKIKGFEKVRFEDPYAAGIGNSIRHMSAAPRDDYMKVDNVDNLFTAGEKSGFYIGHTEAIVTGYLAGNNAVRHIVGRDKLRIPSSTVIGDFVSHSNSEMRKDGGDKKKFTFAGADYFERMMELDLYTINADALRKRIKSEDLLNIYNEKLI